MENATNFADAKDPNRRANHLKKLKKGMKAKPFNKKWNATTATTLEKVIEEVGNKVVSRAELISGLSSRALKPPTVTIPERRKGDRRAKPKTRMNFGTEVHTEWFDADKDHPKYEGRYKVKYAGAARFVFRYFDPKKPEGQKWQYNRRKAAEECVQPGAGDTWRGLAAKPGV